MTYGPIDFIALEFQGNRFRGETLVELIDLVEKEIIRIIDLVVVVKDKDGVVDVMELQQLDAAVLASLEPLDAEDTGILTVKDIEDLASQLDNETAAGLMLIENLWATRTIEALERANARLVTFDRIPHQVVVPSAGRHRRHRLDRVINPHSYW